MFLLFIGGNGCDLESGCQLCLKFKANFEQNLPLCPSSVGKNNANEETNTQLENCMKNCANQSTTCIGFDFNPLTSLCNYIRTYSNWTINRENNFKRYLLSYPPKTYQFLPDCQLINATTYQTNTSDECLSKCRPPCQKVSYNYDTKRCQLGGYSTGVSRVGSRLNSNCFIRNFVRNNDLASIRMAFYRYIGYRLNVQSFQNFSFQCSNDCSIELDQCLTHCLNSLQCQYVSVTYRTIKSFSCSLLKNRINETKDFISNYLSEIYYRYFNINLNQETINNMTLFQVEADLAQCYDQTKVGNKYTQTYSTLKGFKYALNGNIIHNISAISLCWKMQFSF